MAEFRIANLPPGDSRIAEIVFEFVQFLLDDDANLTPAGNLTGAARQKLRGRVQELLAGENLPGEVATEPTEASEQP